jgi:hypothetical protein
MFFGQFLLAKGAIDRDALLDALDRQQSSNLSLPDLAVRQGIMNREQSASVMARYRLSERSIEEILVDGNFLSSEQVEELQRKQRGSWLRIGSALVEGGHLTEAELAAALKDYRSLESAANQRIRDAMTELPDADAVSTFVELTVFHFSRLTGRPAKLVAVETSSADLADGRQRFSQRVVGERDFTVAIDIGPEVVSWVARGMLGFDVDPGSETEADAVCELVNLIGGNACTRIEQLGTLLRPEPPVWSGAGVVVAPSASPLRASVGSGDRDFDILVFTPSDEG